jgi:hypothetical protein
MPLELHFIENSPGRRLGVSVLITRKLGHALGSIICIAWRSRLQHPRKMFGSPETV